MGKSVSIQQRMTVAQMMFRATTLYKPEISEGFTSRAYFVFWKTDDQPDHVPKWEDSGIQAKVAEVWKLDKARKVAHKVPRS